MLAGLFGGVVGVEGGDISLFSMLGVTENTKYIYIE